MRALADARMEMRLSAPDKQVLTQAATLLETNVTAFVLASALAEARSVLDAVEVLRLPRPDFEAFVAALSRPVPASPGLAQARLRLARARALAELPIERLDPERHDLDDFDSGLPAAGTFLKKRAPAFERNALTRTYVLPDTAPRPRALAYYTLSMASMQVETPARRPGRPFGPRAAEPLPGPEAASIAVLRMPYFAVATRVQGHGLGGLLMADMIERALVSVAPLGVGAVLVDTPDAESASWYARFGFVSHPRSPDTMYLVLPAASPVARAGA